MTIYTNCCVIIGSTNNRRDIKESIYDTAQKGC